MFLGEATMQGDILYRCRSRHKSCGPGSKEGIVECTLQVPYRENKKWLTNI